MSKMCNVGNQVDIYQMSEIAEANYPNYKYSKRVLN